MSENTKPNNERPADLAVQDSVGGMARRLLNPAHLRDLAGRSVKTLREQGGRAALARCEIPRRAGDAPRRLAAPRRHSAAPGTEGPARRAPAGAEDQHHRAAVQHARQTV